jgi:hypothetical protein
MDVTSTLDKVKGAGGGLLLFLPLLMMVLKKQRAKRAKCLTFLHDLSFVYQINQKVRSRAEPQREKVTTELPDVTNRSTK